MIERRTCRAGGEREGAQAHRRGDPDPAAAGAGGPGCAALEQPRLAGRAHRGDSP